MDLVSSSSVHTATDYSNEPWSKFEMKVASIHRVISGHEAFNVGTPFIDNCEGTSPPSGVAAEGPEAEHGDAEEEAEEGSEEEDMEAGGGSWENRHFGPFLHFPRA